MVNHSVGKGALAVCAALALAGCENGAGISLFQKKDSAEAGTQRADTSTRQVERDVEAPDVFQKTEEGLWDGRPSLGGVWVTYTDVKQAERVIIRNETNGKFVIGMLYARERETPGPKLQVSSDAALAIDMLGGQPTMLNVTALRKEEVPAEPPAAETPPAEAVAGVEDSGEITTEPLAAAAAAIDKAEGQVADTTAGKTPAMKVGDITGAGTETAAAKSAPAPKPKASPLDKPFIQIGLYNIEENANGTGQALRNGGIVPTIRKQESRGKTFWRVLVGPATSKDERETLLKEVKKMGYADAYYVTD
ncbi:MAG: SPOR domain-containing protein [Paracoccaceae bacterium]